MVDSADLGFYGAAWRFADFCQQLFARSVYLQFVLKCRRTPRLHSSANNHRESHIEFRSPGSVSDERPRLLCSRLALSRRPPRHYRFLGGGTATERRGYIERCIRRSVSDERAFRQSGLIK